MYACVSVYTCIHYLICTQEIIFLPELGKNEKLGFAYSVFYLGIVQSLMVGFQHKTGNRSRETYKCVGHNSLRPQADFRMKDGQMHFSDLLTFTLSSAKYTRLASSLLWREQHKGSLICVPGKCKGVCWCCCFCDTSDPPSAPSLLLNTIANGFVVVFHIRI